MLAGKKKKVMNIENKEKADINKLSANEKIKIINKIIEGKRTDWYSIFMMFTIMLLSGIQLTIYSTSIWPYILLLDPSSHISSLGYALAFFSLGHVIGSPFFGGIATRFKSNKLAISIGLVINVIGNIIYASLQEFSKKYIIYFVCISRFLIGFGIGINGVLRSYCVTACIPDDRRKVVALFNASFVVGGIIGPSLQALFTYFDTTNKKFIIFNINMFTIPALFMVFLYIISIIYCSIKFEETFIGIEKASLSEDIRNNKKIKLFKINYTAVVICIIITFIHSFTSTIIDTLATPLSIAQYNWNDSEVILYNGLINTSSSVIAFVNYMLQAFTFVHNIDQRKLLIFGLSTRFTYPIFNYPWFFYQNKLDHIPVMENGTEYPTIEFGGCSNKYEWCDYVNRVPLIIYCITMTFYLAFGNPFTSAPNSSLYADILGLRRQGFMQGMYELFGSIARVIGSIIGSYLFSISGTIYVMILQGFLILFTIVLVIIFYQRLIPLEFA
uniref:MFS domain-containing protein n=1 Tax=Strongyloides stercoralis TaxID=6248 RepID=A0A0K0EJB9_STRER